MTVCIYRDDYVSESKQLLTDRNTYLTQDCFPNKRKLPINKMICSVSSYLHRLNSENLITLKIS